MVAIERVARHGTEIGRERLRKREREAETDRQADRGKRKLNRESK